MSYSHRTLRHLVFFRLSAAEGSREFEAVRDKLTAMLRRLPDEIEEIKSLRVGANALSSPASWDIALETSFGSLEALERYRVHPAHEEVVKFIQEVTRERAVVDYWLD